MKIRLLVLSIISAFVIQVANATPLLLPDSSYYQGSSYTPVNQNGDTIRIDFAVYDTQVKNELTAAGFGDAPGVGRYIYAYQIYTPKVDMPPLEYFAIMGIGKDALKEPVNNNIGSVDDGSSGVNSDKSYIGLSSSQGTLGVWEFSNGLLTKDKHSWFLVLRSDHGWTAGSYTFDKTTADATPIPNPEPATLAFLVSGFAAIAARYRRNRNKI